MNTNDLYTKYARVIDMCKDTALEDTPWKCVALGTQPFKIHPRFNHEGPATYKFAAAILEDKPVFVGDDLYDMCGEISTVTKDEGKSIELNHYYWAQKSDIGSHFTWQPPEPKKDCIELTKAEIQSGLDRVRFAELLIKQLPVDHDGRNTWLLNYGSKNEQTKPPEPKQAKKPAYELRIIQELTDLANCNSLDVQCNMPDFVIGAYLYKSLQALMEANKANGEYFKLSAQEDEAKTQ